MYPFRVHYKTDKTALKRIDRSEPDGCWKEWNIDHARQLDKKRVRMVMSVFEIWGMLIVRVVHRTSEQERRCMSASACGWMDGLARKP